MVEILHNEKKKWLLGNKETCPNHSAFSWEDLENNHFSLDFVHIASFLVHFLSARDGTQGFVYAREMLYH